ncbi:MAG: TfoX/Sxy family protein [Pseudomonadota bacterium]
MAVDETLNERLRQALADLPGISEVRMMGGTCFLLNGNMLGGADRDKSGEPRFMFRVGKENEAEALGRPGAVPMVFGERRMGGLVFVDTALCDDHDLMSWIALAQSFVAELPPKKKARRALG